MSVKHSTRIKLYGFFFAVLLFPSFLFCQTPKGLVVTANESVTPGKTRALVVGISNYQYIDSLKYAHRDAEVFAAYLQETHFWGIDKEDITLLVNDKAKNGDMITQLARIAQLSKPGDNLLFYFSGHGDVETITQFNNGFLLAFDTYNNNYIAGALPISFLKELFVTLINKNIRVIVIADACKSGKLAGGMKGSEYVASSFLNMWSNQLKILSTQPGRLSYEGIQWGNGRGVFSWYLIKGMNGEADSNKDSIITIAELESYVGYNVSTETKGKQQPFFEGPDKFTNIIVKLVPTKTKVSKKPGGNSFKNISHFLIPEDSCDYYFRQMNTAIEEKRFDSKKQQSASAFYRRLKTCTKDTGFILQANSQLLAALMNNAQEIVNNSFIGKKLVSEGQFIEGIELFDQVLKNNDLKLPYDKHLTNLKRYLHVLGTTLWGNQSALPALEPTLDSALKQEPDAAYLIAAKGILELRKMNYTKAIQILEKATEMAPGWLIPKYYLGVGYGNKKNYRKALDYYEEVLRKDSLYRTFECVKCIQEKMAEFTARLNRVRFDKYLDDKTEISTLDSLRNSLSDNIDSAYFYHKMGRKYDKKNHPYQDSVFFFYSHAVDLDPEEPQYIYSFLRFLQKESYGAMEIRELLIGKMDNYGDEDKNMLQHELLVSYLGTKEFEKAFKISIQLQENGFYSCADLKKLKKYFRELSAYQAYMKECRNMMD